MATRARSPGIEIDAMSLPVLVTALVAEEHDVAVVGEPYDPGTEIAVSDPGQRARLRRVTHVGHPQVEHAAKWSEEGDAASVGAQPYDRSVRAPEENVTRNQSHGGKASRGGRSSARQVGGAGRATPDELACAGGGETKQRLAAEAKTYHGHGSILGRPRTATSRRSDVSKFAVSTKTAGAPNEPNGTKGGTRVKELAGAGA